MDLDADAPATRRRGAELEAALLDAAWDELSEKGYSGLTFDAVAERAHTSRPVIYRRWPDKDRLIVATISHHLGKRRISLPDTGSLRGDLIAAMTAASIRSNELVTLVTVLFGGYYSATGETFAQIRDRVIDTSAPVLSRLLPRAKARGERVPAALPAHVVSLPSDLLRHQMLMSLTPPTPEYIASVVDDIVLPLVERYADREAAADSGQVADHDRGADIEAGPDPTD